MAKITVLPGIAQQFDIPEGGLSNAQQAKCDSMESELLQARLDIVELKQQIKGIRELFEGNKRRLGLIDVEIQKLGGDSYTKRV